MELQASMEVGQAVHAGDNHVLQVLQRVKGGERSVSGGYITRSSTPTESRSVFPGKACMCIFDDTRIYALPLRHLTTSPRAHAQPPPGRQS